MDPIIKSIFYNDNYLDFIYPSIVYFKINSDCNMDCFFCSQSGNSKSELDINKAKYILNELRKINVVSIIYTGGEPLLYNDLLELVKYGKELGFKQTLVTNLFHIKDINVFDYVDSVGVSLHGTEITHNKITGRKSFHKVLNNIDLLLRRNKILNLNSTLCAENTNRKDLGFLVKYARKNKLKLFFGRLNFIGYAKNQVKEDINNSLEIINQFKSKYKYIYISNCIAPCVVDEKYSYLVHSCGAGIVSISVNYRGDITICPSSNYVVGNILETNFKKILIKNKQLELYRNLAYLPNYCKCCKHAFSCRGGCHAEGNLFFWDNITDDLVNEKINNIEKMLSNKILYLNVNVIKREKNKFFIISNKIRCINKDGIKILMTIDGSKTFNEIVRNSKNEKIVKEFIVTLFIEKIIEVK
ncbi:MAG: radical SAM protein [Bacilli bacterium]